MRNMVLAVSLLALAVACGQPAQETASPDDSSIAVSTEADLAAIEAVREAEVAAFESGDPSLSHMVHSLVIMPPNEAQAVGMEAGRAWAEAFMGAATIDALDYTDSSIIVAGDWAIEHYGGAVTMTPADGESIDETIKGIHIYQRQEDGSWKMTHDIWNFDAAM